MILDQHGEQIKSYKLPVDMKAANPFERNVINGLGQLAGLFGGQGFGQAPLSSTNTLYYNTSPEMISNNRTILSYMYAKHGIVQTLVDQPVDDAFRAGFEITSKQLNADDILKLEVFIEQERVIDSIMQTLKWNRLYGGAATIVVTNQDPSTPLNYNAIKEDSPLSFLPVDLWELNYGNQFMYDPSAALTPATWKASFYNYYGINVNSSRVFPVRGKAAPSFLRPRFLGWGMSEIERLIRPINQYLKNQDVIFELLDEAKVDIYKIKGFNQALMTSIGTQNVAQRIQHANMLKNYNNALTMDVNDEYEQKTIAFTGLAEMLEQIRIEIASNVKMPVTKLFGISSAGFNSGEDDIENYNSMIEGEIRSKCKYIVVDALKISCQKLFGFVPDDLQIIWSPLRILNAEEEEKVKDFQHKRVLATYNSGLCTDQEAKAAINKDGLFPIAIDEDVPAELPLSQQEVQTKPEARP